MHAQSVSEAGSLKAASTLMYQEAESAAAIVEAQLLHNEPIISDIVVKLKQLAPSAIVTCARGSSDHAATYAKYLFESQLGILTSSASPSISSVYNCEQQLNRVLYIAISQSGASPDLLSNVDKAKANGATVLALVNVEDSPLVERADFFIPLKAGTEKSVAATKSYIATLSALLQLCTIWNNDSVLHRQLQQLPDLLKRAFQLDWRYAESALLSAQNMFVIGRGFGFGIAQEAALKFKETTGIHAEAFSAAEVKHGPMAIVNENFPVLIFSQQDETQNAINELADNFQQRGVQTLIAATGNLNSNDHYLPVINASHPAIEPLLLIQSFYKLVNGLAVARGYNPDEPPHLKKVTETL